MLTAHILTEVEKPDAFAFQIREDGKQSLYLSDFKYRDKETALIQAAHMVEEISSKYLEDQKEPQSDTNVVGLLERKRKMRNVDFDALIGPEAVSYIDATTRLSDPILTRVETTCNVTAEEQARLNDAVQKEINRTLDLFSQKLADCRLGFQWYMTRFPGAVPPIQKR